jgi:hypothetical protein
MDSLAYRTARNNLQAFAGEGDIIEKSYEAMECRDCEDFIRMGLDSIAWIQRLDRGVRVRCAKGTLVPNAEGDEKIDGLYRAWLKPCALAVNWANIQKGRDFDVDNLDELLRLKEIVLKRVREADVMQEISNRVPTVELLRLIEATPQQAWGD